jgi:glycosyltransferase involved in cell wall biosynthesis
LIPRSIVSPELTYIIPAYNGAHSIKRTILSIMDQPGERIPRIIVVDDGSTDQTIDIVSTHADQLLLLQQRNAGPGAARNLGLQVCETEMVCFVDQDDYVIGPHRRSVEQAWSKDVDVIIGLAAKGTDDTTLLMNRNIYGSDSTNRALLLHFISDNCVQTSTICWSTRFLQKIGGWDTTLCGPEDIELAMRAFLENARVKFSDCAGWVVWHEHSSSFSKNLSWRLATSQVRMHKNLIKLMESKNCDREVTEQFLRRCSGLGRVLYLNGFRDQAMELFSIAWDRRHTEHSGPRMERILAGLIGTPMVLSTRRAAGRLKRRCGTWL